MLRRLSKNNDLMDVVKSCPSGVLDDIYEIEYFISGHPDVVVSASFEKRGHILEVIIPSQDLADLSNGVMMRKCSYRVEDSSYPDGYYNLEFVDSLDVWLGDDEVDPFEPGGEYLTAADLKTINNQSIVGTGNITIEVPDYYATKSWVSSQGYLTSVPASYATKSWVSSQGYLTSVPTGYATKSWVSSQGYLTSVPSGYATESYVTTALSSYALLSDIPSLEGYATESFVTSALSSYATLSDIPSLEGYATESWVSEQGYLTSVPSGYATESYVTTALSGYATESWVEYFVDNNDQNPCVRVEAFGDLLSIELQNYDYATESWVSEQGYLTSVPSGYATESYVTTALSGYATESFVTSALSSYATLSDIPSLEGYATESWVSEQGYLTSVPSGYATESWVSSQGYLTSVVLDGYATESWVSSQGYLTSSALSGYATESWVSTNYLPQSDVWTGTMSEWAQLTSEQKASYKIALVTD